MRKIAFFIPSIERGGVERTLTLVLNAFAEMGYEVDLVYRLAESATLSGVSRKARLVELAGAWPVPAPVPPRIRSSLQALPGLVRYLREERPDVLLSFQSSVLAVWARKLAGVGTRLIVRESSVPSEAVARDRRLTARLTLPLKRWTYPQADAIVATSKGAAADLSRVLELPEHRVHLIHNPTFDDSILDRAKEPLQADHVRRVRDDWFWSETTPVVLGVGRLSPEKNFSLLIRAFARVVETHPSRLVILGEGEERGKLSALAESLGVSESVLMPGFVSNPYPYMARASVLVSPSLYEGLPNVIIESLALGVPVVATRCPGGTADILMDGKAGALVPLGDSEAMAVAIRGLLEDQVLAAGYVAEGQRGLGRFRPETAIRKYVDLVESNLSVINRTAVRVLK